jgi:hypothetical protein
LNISTTLVFKAASSYTDAWHGDLCTLWWHPFVGHMFPFKKAWILSSGLEYAALRPSMIKSSTIADWLLRWSTDAFCNNTLACGLTRTRS